MDCPQFKLLIVGDGGTGKTSFVTRHLTGAFENTYKPTVGVEVHPMDFFTNYGKIRFNCWDFAGQQSIGSIRDAYYMKSECAITCAIIMFDVTARSTYQSVPTWHKQLCEVCRDDVDKDGNPMPMHIVLCGNKVDVKTRQVKPKDLTFHRMKNLEYYEISAKSNYNFAKPFLYFAKKLLKKDNLRFVERPALYPAETKVDLMAQLQHEAELLIVASEPLPVNDDVAFE